MISRILIKSWRKSRKRGCAMAYRRVQSDFRIHWSKVHGSDAIEPDIVGSENDTSKIVDMLVEASMDEAFHVVPIVGVEGLGKTALARQVFNDVKMDSPFTRKIWLRVSGHFGATSLLKMFFHSLTGEYCLSREEVLEWIPEELGCDRYLLVLDDVWSDELDEWDDFISSLAGVSFSKGNAVVVTTRKDSVAAIVKTLPVYELSALSENDCWSIIKAKAFKGADAPAEFEEIGKRIAQICKGLPLAAKVIGGLLNGKSIEDWVSILETLLAPFVRDENYLWRILKLSFDLLPSSLLKNCFAYCSVFPHDFEIEKEKLSELWMAEGFLQIEAGNEMETVGNVFFNHILQNSLFQNVERDKYGNITQCTMHDLVRDLASLVSGMKGSGSNYMHPVRYLYLNSVRDEPFSIAQDQAQYVRTLLIEGIVVDKMLFDFKRLHTLILVGYIKELSSQIGDLIHLRYLDVDRTPIASLPDSVGKLYNLQTLRVQYVKKLPNTITYLVNLRHLHIWCIQLPPGIQKLTCLRALPFYKVGHEKGCGIGELGSLKNLGGKLEIQNLEKVSNKEEASCADLFGKANISHLIFSWDYETRRDETNDENVLEGLQPSQNLKTLEIKGYKGKKFPLWTMQMAAYNDKEHYCICLNNLITLTLSRCDECEEIPMLGHLPHLSSLYLSHLPKVKSIGLQFYGNGSCSTSSKVFPALKRLEFLDMPILTEWVDVEGETTGFPSLEHLSINRCPILESSPSHFTCLQILYISDVDSCLPLANICDGGISSLKRVTIICMSGLIHLPEGLFVKNRSLTSLYISYCPNLTHLVPSSLSGGESLEYLGLQSCEKLRELPNDLHRLRSLKELSIHGCQKLKTVPYQSGDQSQGGLISLQSLIIRDCLELTTLPIEMLESCAKQLENFTLRNLPALMNFPEEFSSLISLQSLVIGQFSDSFDLVSFNNILRVSQSLRSISLYGHEYWEYLPDQLQNLTALKHLYLYDFGSIEALPEWLGNLSSLQILHVENCRKLTFLPSTEAILRLNKLEFVTIVGCPLLKERCSQQQSNGSDNSGWTKISHILVVQIR